MAMGTEMLNIDSVIARLLEGTCISVCMCVCIRKHHHHHEEKKMKNGWPKEIFKDFACEKK